jgi:hypothetical protein
MENCPIKSEYEDFLYEKMQKQNIINAIEIRWCGKYQPKNLWSNK